MLKVESLRESLRQADQWRAAGRIGLAQAVYEEILLAEPECLEALHGLGTAALLTANPKRAVEQLGKAAMLAPANAAVLTDYGNALVSLGQYVKAFECYDSAIAADPRYAEAFYNRANAWLDLGRYQNAVHDYDKAIALKSDHALAYNNRGIALANQLRSAAALASGGGAGIEDRDRAVPRLIRVNNAAMDVALRSFDRSIAINPSYAEAYYNRGIVLQEIEDFGAAVDSYDRAIGLNSNYAEAYANRGAALHKLLKLDDARASYDSAIAIRPEFAEAQYNRAMALLLAGDLAAGWIANEWRWKSKGGHPERKFSQPRWYGQEPLSGKTILLHAEQGLGDTIQFCRYAKIVADVGATVWVEAQAPMIGLLDTLAGVTRLVRPGEALSDFDVHCPLMSLPLAFRTTLANVPAAHRYLYTDAARVAYWQGRLGRKTRTRVGLAWSGNPLHVDDRHRSVPLSDLLPYLPADFQYVSLQKDLRPDDAGLLATAPHILNPVADIEDFRDTAALCECMDVVISVDTSIAHLSGALGRETWVLLSFCPDWRWLLNRNDSPWYPTVKLYRQPAPGDWSSVFAAVSADLVERWPAGQVLHPGEPSAL